MTNCNENGWQQTSCTVTSRLGIGKLCASWGYFFQIFNSWTTEAGDRVIVFDDDWTDKEAVILKKGTEKFLVGFIGTGNIKEALLNSLQPWKRNKY